MMTGALEAEPREGTTVRLVSDALSSPALLRENSLIHEGTDEAVALEVYPGFHGLHAAEEALLDVCRVCQCSEADRTGEAALKVLGISAPSQQNMNASTAHVTIVGSFAEEEKISSSADCLSVDRLMDLGCACKNDLALAHYACALRWFVSRGSVTCEICGAPALNVRLVDRIKVLCALKGKNALQYQSHVVAAMGSGEINATIALPNSSEELVQVTAWFAPVSDVTSLSRSFSEQVIDVRDEGFTSTSPATKWAVEAAGIFIATGLLTVTITWLLSPRVDKITTFHAPGLGKGDCSVAYGTGLWTCAHDERKREQERRLNG